MVCDVLLFCLKVYVSIAFGFVRENLMSLFLVWVRIWYMVCSLVFVSGVGVFCAFWWVLGRLLALVLIC